MMPSDIVTPVLLAIICIELWVIVMKLESIRKRE